jgi:hypothetical protein
LGHTPFLPGQRLAILDTDPRNTVIHSAGQQVGVQFLEDCIYILPGQAG